MWISAGLGAIALLFTLSGIYAVVAYSVAQRTKEIGIRIAIGASIRAVVHLVAGDCLRLATLGIAIGAVLALGAGKILSTQVMITPFDLGACFGGILIVFSVCAAAAFWPASRAAHVDPHVTLRYD
jgi:ABC-type antimicrobial peptide transport system permease subunit